MNYSTIRNYVDPVLAPAITTTIAAAAKFSGSVYNPFTATLRLTLALAAAGAVADSVAQRVLKTSDRFVSAAATAVGVGVAHLLNNSYLLKYNNTLGQGFTTYQNSIAVAALVFVVKLALDAHAKAAALVVAKNQTPASASVATSHAASNAITAANGADLAEEERLEAEAKALAFKQAEQNAAEGKKAAKQEAAQKAALENANRKQAEEAAHLAQVANEKVQEEAKQSQAAANLALSAASSSSNAPATADAIVKVRGKGHVEG